MCKLVIKDLYWGGEVEIIRDTRHKCTAVARAHYKGDRYKWVWG